MPSFVLLILLLVAGCGGGPAVAHLASVTPKHTNVPVPPKDPGVHFTTPEAAMRYLASAWNSGDITRLKHVTDPAARQQLVDMYSEARDLKLDHCSLTKERGDYECYFKHGFPKGYKSQGPVGSAEFTVGPADKPGWYMTYFVSCGG